MGLFDTVRCDYPLPDPAHQDLEFQTKDLECLLERYTITRDGRLVRHSNKGVFSRGLVRDVEWPIHGDLHIHESLDRPGAEREWVEYRFRFTDGIVERVERIEERKTAFEEPRVRHHEPRLGIDARIAGALRPAAEGRSITADELWVHAPEKLELVDGGVPGGEEFLLLLLTQVGLRRAADLVGHDLWGSVLAADD